MLMFHQPHECNVGVGSRGARPAKANNNHNGKHFANFVAVSKLAFPVTADGDPKLYGCETFAIDGYEEKRNVIDVVGIGASTWYISGSAQAHTTLGRKARPLRHRAYALPGRIDVE